VSFRALELEFWSNSCESLLFSLGCGYISYHTRAYSVEGVIFAMRCEIII